MENTKILESIKSSLNRLSYWEKLADQAEDAYEANPENPDREEAFDHAYDLSFNEYVYAVHLISRFAGLDENTVKKLVNTKRAEMITAIDKAIQKV